MFSFVIKETKKTMPIFFLDILFYSEVELLLNSFYNFQI